MDDNPTLYGHQFSYRDALIAVCVVLTSRGHTHALIDVMGSIIANHDENYAAGIAADVSKQLDLAADIQNSIKQRVRRN